MTTMEELMAALRAMDVLNRWVRKYGENRPRKAVYWLKSKYAIRDAVMVGLLVKMRPVKAVVECNRCRKGVYYDWDGVERGQCYHCKGKGQTELKFVETDIANEFHWHTPLGYSNWLGWPMEDLEFGEPTGEWAPGKDGITLPVVEAARLLNIVEEFWPQWRKASPYELSRDEYDSSRYYIFNYSLDLGCVRGGGRCLLCNAGELATGYHCHTYPPGLSVQDRVCEACADRNDLWKALAEVPLPQLSPEITRWQQRHSFDFEASWGRNQWNNSWRDRRKEPFDAPKSAGLFKVTA